MQALASEEARQAAGANQQQGDQNREWCREEERTEKAMQREHPTSPCGPTSERMKGHVGGPAPHEEEPTTTSQLILRRSIMEDAAKIRERECALLAEQLAKETERMDEGRMEQMG